MSEVEIAQFKENYITKIEGLGWIFSSWSDVPLTNRRGEIEPGGLGMHVRFDINGRMGAGHFGITQRELNSGATEAAKRMDFQLGYLVADVERGTAQIPEKEGER